MSNCLLEVYTVLLVFVIATGLSKAQSSDEAFDALMNSIPIDSETDSEFIPAGHFPDDTDGEYATNALANLLKRSGYNNNYLRLPRIKQQRIIPFYSYENDYRTYRASPRYTGSSRYRTPYYYTPWNMETYRPSRYLNKQVYGGYRRK